MCELVRQYVAVVSVAVARQPEQVLLAARSIKASVAAPTVVKRLRAASDTELAIRGDGQREPCVRAVIDAAQTPVCGLLL